MCDDMGEEGRVDGHVKALGVDIQISTPSRSWVNFEENLERLTGTRHLIGRRRLRPRLPNPLPKRLSRASLDPCHGFPLPCEHADLVIAVSTPHDASPRGVRLL